MHYIPRDDVYVYFRFTDQERVMVVVNNNTKDQSLTLDHYSEGIAGRTQAYEVISDQIFTLSEVLEVPAETTLIMELSL